MATNQDIPDVFVPLGTFDKTKLRLLDAEVHSFKKGKDSVENCDSYWRYEGDDGIMGRPFYEFPPQSTFGPSWNFPYGTSDEDKKTIDLATGYQLSYPLTSITTIDKPTDDEQYVRNLLDAHSELAWQKLEEECEKEEEERVVPAPTYNSYLGAISKGKKKANKAYAIKPIYSFPMIVPEGSKKGAKKVGDTEKPRRIYIFHSLVKEREEVYNAKLRSMDLVTGLCLPLKLEV